MKERMHTIHQMRELLNRTRYVVEKHQISGSDLGAGIIKRPGGTCTEKN